MSSVIKPISLERRRTGSVDDAMLLDYRERRALESLERAAVRRQDCAELVAAQNSAGVRIRAWEKVHQLRMPSTPHHPVLQVIATATQLSLADVQDEQRQRAERRAASHV